MTLVELALILVYLSVVVIKSCDLSALQLSDLGAARDFDFGAAVCTTYGFGESASGELAHIVVFLRRAYCTRLTPFVWALEMMYLLRL